MKLTGKTVDVVIEMIQLAGMALGVGWFVHLCCLFLK